MSLMYVAPRGRLRETALALLDRDIPDAVRETVLATLGRAYAGATGDTLVPADREAIAHLLSGRARAPVSLVTSAPSSADLMGVFVSAVSDDPVKLAVLGTTILAALRARDWERSEVLAWLRSWSHALAEVEAAEIPHHILDALIAEIGGDATARPSLPPELREIVPTISIV